MRRKSLIALLLFAFMFMMADTTLLFLQRKKKGEQRIMSQKDTLKRDPQGHYHSRHHEDGFVATGYLSP